MDVTGLLDRANLLLEQGRNKDAEKQIRQILEQEPNNDHALSILARCYLNNDEIDKGIEIINKAIAIEPNESFYFYLLGFGYFQKDMFLPAKDNLAKAIQLNPYNPEYFGMRSFVYLNEKDYGEALKNANEGLDLDPENITCLNARARALNKLKRTDEAVDTIGDSLAKDPDNKFTHATMGWNYFERGDQKKAAHHFREALRNDPNYESARLGLKESLKSNFTPYKLVLQFSRWMSEKGKNFQWVFYISIYVIFRILRGFAAANAGLRPFLLPLVVFYFVFIFFTWIANPIANFFLLFHKDGKYSLTKSETTISISTIVLLVSGILLGCYAFYFFRDPPDELLYPAIILATMSIPLGKVELPLNLRSGSIRVWYPAGLVFLGILAIPIIFLNVEIGSLLALIYGIALLIFTWVANSW